MTETQVLYVMVGICISLVGVVYAAMNGRQRQLEAGHTRQGERLGVADAEIATLKAQNARQERDVVTLQAQNGAQETAIAGLVQRMIAREEAHTTHRADMRDAIATLTAGMGRLEGKIDQVLRGDRARGTPMPGRYGIQGEGQGGKGG